MFKLLLSTSFKLVCRFSSRSEDKTMRYLCVAEKNDAAKHISQILSRGSSNRRESYSRFNKIYEFPCSVNGQDSFLVMTSVSGHLLNWQFVSTYKNWNSCNPDQLFEAAVTKHCEDGYLNVKKTLEKEVLKCQGLIIWTDCDREGENIGYEIITVCQAIKPNLKIFRAKFSEITAPSIWRAINNLGQPDKNVSDAVDVRSELDLRTGAAFTRLQTLRLQKVFPQILDQKLISYGSCQFPTLGFVVERHKTIECFKPEDFWYINLSHRVLLKTTEFAWSRTRLFDKNAVLALLDICLQTNRATITDVESKPKSKWRPLPLDTVEMEKIISRKLRINAKEVMKIAEKLYTQGLISYPRTETNIFPKEMDLRALVEPHGQDREWGEFARGVMADGPNPRQGKKTDQAHPPIHPTKYTRDLSGNELKVYEYIVRHFLACLSKDAKGHETIVTADCGGEKFIAKGLIILERNYLEVYIYETWNAKEINRYEVGDNFVPTRLDLGEGRTSPPKLLTEADLIALMEKHGIGTDATHAEHIETIKSREYVTLLQNIYFSPAPLGLGLVEGYNNMELEISLSKPNLRSEFEADLKLICEGRKRAEDVRREQIVKYRQMFRLVSAKMQAIDGTLATRLNQTPHDYMPSHTEIKDVMKCPKCGAHMILRQRSTGGWYLGCTNFPTCKNSAWFDSNVVEAAVMNESCSRCGPNVKKVKMRFAQNLFPGEPNPNTFCIGGCDTAVLEALDIPPSVVRRQSHRTSLESTTSTNYSTINNTNNSVNSANNQIRPSQIHNRPRTNNNYNNANRVSNHSTTSATSPNNNYNNTNRTSNQSTNSGNSPDNPLCNCNERSVQRTVLKDNPNKGRKFYSCGKPIGTGCNFFQWNDSASANTSRPNNSPTSRRGTNFKRKHNNNHSSNQPPKRRKCGNCRQEGHTRTNCPLNSVD